MIKKIFEQVTDRVKSRSKDTTNGTGNKNMDASQLLNEARIIYHSLTLPSKVAPGRKNKSETRIFKDFTSKTVE